MDDGILYRYMLTVQNSTWIIIEYEMFDSARNYFKAIIT